MVGESMKQIEVLQQKRNKLELEHEALTREKNQTAALLTALASRISLAGGKHINPEQKAVQELFQLQSQRQQALQQEILALKTKEQMLPRSHYPKPWLAMSIAAIALIILFASPFYYVHNRANSFTGLAVYDDAATPAMLNSMDKEVLHLRNQDGQFVESSLIENLSDGNHVVELRLTKTAKTAAPAGILLEQPSEAISEAVPKAVPEVIEVIVLFDEVYAVDSHFTAQVDEYDREMPRHGKINSPVLFMDGIHFSTAEVRLPASGKINTLFRCNSFDVQNFSCSRWEVADIPFVIVNDTVIFTVDHFSAYAAGEIIAVDAVHLDANYEFISNIYDSIKSIDGIWSEPIMTNEFVRVTYEQNLTDGRIIDIYARSNTEALETYLEVYEAGTTHKVGQSGLIGSAAWHYITVDGLSHSLDLFDFKVVSEDPAALVEFDYIHDDVISSIQSDGMVVYGPLNNASPAYNLWNESYNFTQKRRAEGIGTNGSSDITWVVVKSGYKYDQMILGTQDTSLDTNIQVYNNSAVMWTTPLEVSVNAPNNQRRSFDIEYEGGSGDALIVYENRSSAGGDSAVQYIIWNGTRFSEQENFTTSDTAGNLANSPIQWIKLQPRRRSDEMMLLAHNTTNGLYAVPWSGNLFDTSRGLILSNATESNSKQQFAFGWEEVTGDGLAVYTVSSGLVYRTYSPTTADIWGEETFLAGFRTGGIDALRLCSDPQSQYIGMIWQDGDVDVNVTMWNGSEFLSNPPVGETTTEITGSTTSNIDCTWFNDSSALFGYVDMDALTVNTFTFSKPNTWNASEIANSTNTYNFASDDIASMQFATATDSGEVMILALDLLEDVSLIRYVGGAGDPFRSVAESPIEVSVEAANGGQEVAMFDWFRYDPGPNVTSLAPTLNSQYNANDIIDVGGIAVDNRRLPPIPMYVNITYPNGSNFTYAASNTSGTFSRYNFTFSTNVAGVFTVRFLGNDSRNSLNYTETTNFTVSAAAEPTGGSKNLISIDVFNLSRGSALQGGGLVISSTSNGFTNGTSLSADFVQSTGLSIVNVSGGAININVSLLRNGSHGNYPNVTFAWVLAKANGSTMLNTTIHNNTFNQSAFNYSFSAALLPDGIYNISIYAENISEGATRIVNYSRGFDIGIDRIPPNVGALWMNTSNATTYRLGIAAEIQINVTVNDSTTYAQSIRFGIFSVENNTEFNLTPTKDRSNWYINLALTPLTRGQHIIRLYANDSLGNLNQSVSNLSFILSAAPTPPLIFTPANGSAIINRTPIFEWYNSTDDDGDVLSYHIQVDDNALFNNPEINVSAIQDLSTVGPGNTTWYPNIELAVDTRFYWRVRANDSVGFGNWSNGMPLDNQQASPLNLSNFTIDSLLSITMFTSGVDFGSVAPGTQANTSDGVPAPFRAENTGNIDANVSLNASAIFTTVAINRSAYQFQIRANESNAFSSALSAMSWTNMSASTTAAHVVNLTWRNSRNDFLTDINLTVPSDEPAGIKTSTITFTLTRNE